MHSCRPWALALPSSPPLCLQHLRRQLSWRRSSADIFEKKYTIKKDRTSRPMGYTHTHKHTHTHTGCTHTHRNTHTGYLHTHTHRAYTHTHTQGIYTHTQGIHTHTNTHTGCTHTHRNTHTGYIHTHTHTHRVYTHTHSVSPAPPVDPPWARLPAQGPLPPPQAAPGAPSAPRAPPAFLSLSQQSPRTGSGFARSGR